MNSKIPFIHLASRFFFLYSGSQQRKLLTSQQCNCKKVKICFQMSHSNQFTRSMVSVHYNNHFLHQSLVDHFSLLVLHTTGAILFCQATNLPRHMAPCVHSLQKESKGPIFFIRYNQNYETNIFFNDIIYP